MHELLRKWLDDTNVLLLDNGLVVKVRSRVPHIRTYEVIGKLSVFDNSLGDDTLFEGKVENVFVFMFRRFLCVNKDGHCYSRKHDELYYYGRVDLDSVSKVTSGYEKLFIHRELYILTDLIERVSKFFNLAQDVVEASFEYAKVEERLGHVRNVLQLAGGKSTNADLTIKISDDVEQLLGKRGGFLKVVNGILSKNGSDVVTNDNELIHAINQNLVPDKVMSVSNVMKETGFLQFPKFLSKLEGQVPKGTKFLDKHVPDFTWIQALEERVNIRRGESGLQTLLADIVPRNAIAAQKLTMLGYIEYHDYVVIVCQSGVFSDDWATCRMLWAALSSAQLYTYVDASRIGPIVYGWLL
ncbi:28.7K [Tobacco rattle virus]|uniref:40 kDa protein n=1 Tax=Tobacco rattle virus (isolate PpK20) TaxID=652939 RepID=P40_TRVPP|nr:28.7K [Tobacco rattle virus]Q88898.2 RecName: Full=40 kDa protein [Tobacco rattle virus PpK20]CAA85422.2 28.7K [Tobacco rattle virus]